MHRSRRFLFIWAQIQTLNLNLTYLMPLILTLILTPTLNTNLKGITPALPSAIWSLRLVSAIAAKNTFEHSLLNFPSLTSFLIMLGSGWKFSHYSEVAVRVRINLESLTLILKPQSAVLLGELQLKGKYGKFWATHLILFLWSGLGLGFGLGLGLGFR